MATNVFGQIQGPFAANTEVLPSDLDAAIVKIGITSIWHHFVDINGVKIEIGKTGMYESKDVEITSIKFEQEEDNKTFITYMTEVE